MVGKEIENYLFFLKKIVFILAKNNYYDKIKQENLFD